MVMDMIRMYLAMYCNLTVEEKMAVKCRLNIIENVFVCIDQKESNIAVDVFSS